jgi:hypothetical protein
MAQKYIHRKYKYLPYKKQDYFSLLAEINFVNTVLPISTQQNLKFR